MKLASNLASLRLDETTTPSLPPELLTEIIERAAHCDSTYESYMNRIETLSSLSLTDRTFRELAQPLLAQKVNCQTLEFLEKISHGDVAAKVESLAYDPRSGWPKFYFSARFVNLTELRVSNGNSDVSPLQGHQHLARLAFEKCHLSGWSDLILPQLAELSLNSVAIFPSTGTPRERLADFFSISYFPSLRALGTQSSGIVGLRQDGIVIDHDLACRLDCIVGDRSCVIRQRVADVRPSPSSTSLGCPVPFLFDLDLYEETTYGPSRPSSDPVLSTTHIQIRLPCESTPDPPPIETALSLVKDLLVHSTALQELYIDVYPGDGRRSYVLNGELQERVGKLEDQARKKNVEIIWEDNEEDWCRSLVSKEFWRRSKEKKEMKKGEGNQE